ncbi:MAG: HAMP domain-containing histidine kinase [Ruminococcaceae bacterium]|nr:HAMP domain-containing histidine kinase [Oscillospiraceae bacterium]
MKLKLFKKYFLITVSIVAVSLIVLMMILSMVLNNNFTESSYKTLKQCCVQISDSFEDLSNGESDSEFSNIMVSLSQVADSDIFITDSYGAVVMCACEEWQQNKKCTHSSYIVSKKTIERCVSHNKVVISTLGIYKYPHYIAANVLGSDNSFFVFAAKPLSEGKVLLSKISKIYYLWALIPLVIMIIAIYFMTYRLTKPLKSMSEAAKAMTKGDFSKRIPVTSDDEIGELAVSFNMMTNSLSRLESMRRSFVGDVSHELKTPMTTIGGFIDGILDGTINESEHKYYLNIVSQEIKRLSRLVNGMLSMARLESGEFSLKPQKFDFYELLCTIMISQERRIEESKLEISGLDNLKTVQITADKDLIHQVVYNLVDNAIKFSNQSGSISFTLEETNLDLIFTITNTGMGIPENELPYVFERFYKGDKSRSAVKNSTGLGLYIVKTIISAHKGKISVKSKQNEFTSFKVVLPKEIK